MAPKRKAAFPSKAGRPEKTASKTTAGKSTIPPTRRQRIKAIIFWLGVWGVLPSGVVDWLIQRGGLAND